jgi:hypothetical protein
MIASNFWPAPRPACGFDCLSSRSAGASTRSPPFEPCSMLQCSITLRAPVPGVGSLCSRASNGGACAGILEMPCRSQQGIIDPSSAPGSATCVFTDGGSHAAHSRSYHRPLPYYYLIILRIVVLSLALLAALQPGSANMSTSNINHLHPACVSLVGQCAATLRLFFSRTDCGLASCNFWRSIRPLDSPSSGFIWD